MKPPASSYAFKPTCIWLTGLSGAGKSTIATELANQLKSHGQAATILDGDTLRTGLNKDLGFSIEDRAQSVRRTAEVAKLMLEANLIVIVSLISPIRIDRDSAKGLFQPEDFHEVFISTSLSVCESRDPKGLYKKARQGLIPNFTGLTSPYEEPHAPSIAIDTTAHTPDRCALHILQHVFA